MDNIDKLFECFLHELKIHNRAVKIKVLRYFKILKKIFPDIKVNEFNESKILYFGEKLKTLKIKVKSRYFQLKPQSILNAISLMWRFLFWLRENQVINENDDTGEKTNSKQNYINKLILRSILRTKSEFLFKEKSLGSSRLNSTMIIKSLERRFDLILSFQQPGFFRGIADYVRFVSVHDRLLAIVINNILAREVVNYLPLKIGREEIIDNQDDYLGGMNFGLCDSWFNLELLYLLIFKMRNILDLVSVYPKLLKYIRSLYIELNSVLNKVTGESIYQFRKSIYCIDFMRIHNLLLEVLETKKDTTAHIVDKKTNNEFISYSYQEYDIPTGFLKIEGFNSLAFSKTPALIIQFYYLQRMSNSSFSYKDFNSFVRRIGIRQSSNEFRLIVNSINKRVSDFTNGIVKEILIKENTNEQKKEANKYFFIKNIQTKG